MEYLQYEKSYSIHTVSAYHRDLSQFCEFLEINPLDFDPQLVSSQVVQRWIFSLSAAKLSRRSISRKFSSLSSFWLYLLQQGVVEKNILKSIELPKIPKPLPSFYKDKEMEKIFDSFDQLESDEPNFKQVRDRLIINMLYQTGMRVSELVTIKDSDIDKSLSQLKVLGKGNKQRIIPIGEGLLLSIASYVQERDAAIEKTQSNLLVRENGESMTRGDIYIIVKKYMSTVSTLKQQSPHVLRHTFATTLLNNGAELSAVKELLGHSNLSTTEVYTHVSFNELNKIYKQAHPRAVKKGG